MSLLFRVSFRSVEWDWEGGFQPHCPLLMASGAVRLEALDVSGDAQAVCPPPTLPAAWEGARCPRHSRLPLPHVWLWQVSCCFVG